MTFDPRGVVIVDIRANATDVWWLALEAPAGDVVH
jgi:hypothetical protein